MEVWVKVTYFALTGRNGLVTWTEQTPFLTWKREIRNSAFFGRRLWWERTAQKGAPRLTTENYEVWKNVPLNRKIQMTDWDPDGVLSSILYQMLNLLFERDMFNCWPEEILLSFKFNCWVSYSKGDIYYCWTEAISLKSSTVELRCHEHKNYECWMQSRWTLPLQDISQREFLRNKLLKSISIHFS